MELDRQQRLMRVEGKHRTYEITQDLVDLIKGEPLENYSEPVKNDYNNLMEDVEGSRKAKRLSLLTPVKRGQGFLPDNVTELQSRLEKLISAAKEGHSNVFNEGMAILKRLLEKDAITFQTFKKLSKSFS